MTTLAAMLGSPRFASRALIVLSILASVLVGAVAAPSAFAQADTDFQLTVNAGGPIDGSTDVVVAVNPNASSVAALQAVLTYDSDRLTPSRCVTVSVLGACNIATPGSINLAAVSADGWDTETILFRISFDSVDPVHPQDVSLSITEALTTAGDSISGTVIPLRPIPGDVSCNRTINILDALLIAQHVVGNRTGADDCPLDNDGSGLNLTAADVNGSGTVSIADAVLIAQCVDGRTNELCPA